MCSYALSSTYCLRQSFSRLSYTYVIVKRFFHFFVFSFTKIFSAHRSAFVLLHLLCYPVFYASTTAAFIFCTYSFTYATQSVLHALLRSLQLPIPQLHRLKMPPFFSALYTFQQIVSFTHRHNLAKKRDRCDNICINLFAYRNYVVVRCKSHDFFTFWIHRYDFSFKFWLSCCLCMEVLERIVFFHKKSFCPSKGTKT